MALFHRGVGGFCAVLILLSLVLSPVSSVAAEKGKTGKAAKALPSAEKSDDLPAPELTLGTRAGDDVVEGFGDILAPIVALKSGIVFINPRASMSDHSAEEYNLGVGYRHLLRDKGMIFGANVYYDYRETESGNRFNQLGVGVEYLSDWVDARANYYLPENQSETVESEVTTTYEADTEYTRWYDPYAERNNIYQQGTFYKGVTTTKVTQHFIQYEEAMEGFDMELGVRLPIPTVMDYADVKVFGGFYHYNRDFGMDDLNGFKGRLEIKAMPSLYLDLEIFDSKDLTGCDFYLGARLSVPFEVANISKGRNPFAGAIDGMRIQKQKTTIASRLTEMVMRDLHVQTDYSPPTEVASNRTSMSTTLISVTQRVSDTLATDVIFVNQDTGNDANPGTIELPVKEIPTGISLGSNVFVMATVAPYVANLQIGRNVNLMGQGFPIGHDGKYLNGDSRYAVIKGLPHVLGEQSSGGPTVWVRGLSPEINGSMPSIGAENVQIRGFEIQNEISVLDVAGAIKIKLPSSTAVYVDNVKNFELAYNKLDNALIGFGAMYDDIPTFTVNVHDNTFDTLGLGAGVVAMGSQGSLTFSRNTIQNTLIGMAGVSAGSEAYGLREPSTPTVLNAQITDNIVKGGGLGILAISNLQLGPLSLMDVLPPDAAALAGKGVTADSTAPSLSALNVVALDLAGEAPATVNATFARNVIEDNLLGIGAAGIGPNAVVNANIQNNTLTGGGLNLSIGSAVSGLADDRLDWSLIGIWMLGASNATLDNAVIANNTIMDHALGIGVLGLGAASMNNGQIMNNTISDSLLGIVVAGYSDMAFRVGRLDREPAVSMNNWTIGGNRISGNGVGQIVDLVLDILPATMIPDVISSAIEELVLPNTGLAGILVAGISAGNDTLGAGSGRGIPVAGTEMNGYTIAGNTIDNEILGIGVVGVGGDRKKLKTSIDSYGTEMNGYRIGQNSIQHTAIGIGVVGYSGARMLDYEISQNDIRDTMVGVAGVSTFGSDLSCFHVHNNAIVGGDLDDLFTALAPIANTNVIPNADVVDLLKLPLPETGGVGVLALNYDADMYDISIDNNAISKNLAGVLVAGLDYADMDGIVINNNSINDSYLGIGVLSAGDYVEIRDGQIMNNVINDPVIGIMALTMDYAWMDNWTISGNQVNRSLVGVLAAASDGADMTNLTVSANTISGANDAAKVALMTRFMDDVSLIGDIEDVLDMDWDPAKFPNSGVVGIAVAGEHAGEMGVVITGNQLSNEAIAGEVNLENQPSVVPIAYINNTSSDGQFFVNGTNYVLTQVGNVPSPVIEAP